MRRLPLGMLILLLAGCSRSEVALPQRPPIQPLAGGNLYRQADARPIGWYEGQTAKQWAEQLTDQDPQVRQQASQALGALGGDGVPYLIQGMRSSSPEVKLNSLQGFYKPDLVQHADETMPLVIDMLKNRDPAIRLNAVSRLPWYEARARNTMPMLQYLAANDPSPEVRTAARESMVFINYSVTGVMPKHGH